jgi:hypothetical protein
MKTRIRKWFINSAKRALVLILAGVSIMVGWVAGITFVFVVPLMMVSWIIGAITWSILGIFTFFCCQTADLYSACGSKLQAEVV